MKKHLAIMSKSAIEAIFSGKKVIETRFSKHNIPPFGVIGRGDVVFMKPPGEEIVGQFKVGKVIFIDGLEGCDIDKIFTDYGPKISMGNIKEDQSYQQLKQESTYGTLIFISECERFITSPIRVRKIDRRGWMVLEETKRKVS